MTPPRVDWEGRFRRAAACAQPPRSGKCCPRPCENAQEPTMWRIFFSIAHFPIAATGLFFFRLTKLRRTFYVQVECLCFHTGWPQSGHPPVSFDDLVGAGEDRWRHGEAERLGGVQVDNQFECGRLLDWQV